MSNSDSEQLHKDVRFEVLTEVKILMLVLWGITPYRLVRRNQRFVKKYCLYFNSSTEDGDRTIPQNAGV
jgi:hypothetical protein